MVDARLRFLGRGHYAPVEQALAAVVAEATAPGVVLDVGSGPGTYLAHALGTGAAADRLGVALDLSAVAIRRAARIHPRAGAVVGDVTERLPAVDDAAAVVLDVFAPRNQREYARVLHPTGVLAVVTPRTGHLAELAEATIAVDPEKERRLHDSLTPSFVLRSSDDLTWTMELTAEDVHDVVHMGPSHHHVDPERTFASATVTAAVTVSTWTPVAEVAARLVRGRRVRGAEDVGSPDGPDVFCSIDDADAARRPARPAAPVPQPCGAATSSCHTTPNRSRSCPASGAHGDGPSGCRTSAPSDSPSQYRVTSSASSPCTKT